MFFLFFFKHLKKQYLIHISHSKCYIHFCRLTPLSPKNGHALQNYFSRLLKNFFFFNWLMKNIQNLFPTKKVISVPPWLKGLRCRNRFMHRGETTAQDLLNEPVTKTVGENVASVESVESLVTKKWLLQKSNLKIVLVFEFQNYLKVTVTGIF